MVRALLSPGPARQFFKLAPLHHQLLYHVEQLTELSDVAARPRLKIAAEAVTELIDRLERYGLQIESNLDVILECRDSKDNYVLAIALSGAAEIILTEDEDLLVLNPWREIRIMRLFQFMNEHPLPRT
jgi:putative PIN family toxin of toxin-antitoxin system